MGGVDLNEVVIGKDVQELGKQPLPARRKKYGRAMHGPAIPHN